MQARPDPSSPPPQATPAQTADDRFADCLDAVVASDPAVAASLRQEGGPVGAGLLSALQGGPVGDAAVLDLSPDARMALFRRLYWQPSRAGLLPSGADRAMLALAIRVGPHRAILAAQHALGIEEDGVLDAARLPAFTPASAGALEAALDKAGRDAG